MKLHWIIDVDIIGEANADLPRHLRSLGYSVTPLSATKDFPKLAPLSDGVYAFHGSFEELRKVQKVVQVATYGMGPSVLRSHYTAHLPLEWFFNADAVMTTWGDFCRRPFHYKTGLGIGQELDRNVFVRPDSGFKVFTGQTINLYDFEEDRTKIEQFSTVRPETIIWVSHPARRITQEYRIWISNGKVIAGSEYSWTDKECNAAIPAAVSAFAEKIAAYEWQLDRIYVVDVHYHEQAEPKIIEFNSFSCSGLYNCDSKTLFEQVSKDILEEWTDDFTEIRETGTNSSA